MNRALIMGAALTVGFCACNNEAKEGAEKGPCLDNGSCNAGLRCLSELCVKDEAQPQRAVDRTLETVVAEKSARLAEDTRDDTTRLMVSRVANEVYTRWALATGEECPASLEMLAEFMDGKPLEDAWGQKLAMVCGDDAPKEAVTGFGVLSFGADGKRGSSDDISSWEL